MCKRIVGNKIQADSEEKVRDVIGQQCRERERKNKVKVSLVYHKLNLDIVSGKKLYIKWGVYMFPNRKRKINIKICQISIIVLK